MGIFLLKDLAILSCFAVILQMVCYSFRIPVIVGFLLTGVLTGPQGLALITLHSSVEILAEIGVILLLFSVGMELPFHRIKEFYQAFFVGGSLQVFITGSIGFFIATLLGRPFGESLFLGFLVSLSSTAIVSKILTSRYELETPYGKTSLAICLFQDVMTIPMILLTPFLGGDIAIEETSPLKLVENLIILSLFSMIVFKGIPYVFSMVTRQSYHELFLISVLAICFGTAWVCYQLGLPVALGSFLAGLFLANLEYRHQAISAVSSLKDTFLGLFFISIGMLMDLKFLVDYWMLILLVAFAIIFAKAFVASAVCCILRMPLHSALMVGFALAEIGEFSFVLLKAGRAFNLGTEFYIQLFLSVALLTMAGATILVERGPLIVDFLFKFIPQNWLHIPLKHDPHFFMRPQKKDHVIIIGYGECGKIVGETCERYGIDFLSIDINPEVYHAAKDKGTPILFGDALHHHVLRQANIIQAHAVVITTNDPHGAFRIAKYVRTENPQAKIILRCAHIRHIRGQNHKEIDWIVYDHVHTAKAIGDIILEVYSIPIPVQRNNFKH